MKTFSHLWQYLAEFFVEWEIFHIKVVDKIKIHILCSVAFFRKSCRYEIMKKNMVEPERPQMGIWRRVPCCISRLHARKHTQKCVTLIAFLRQHLCRERASVLRYTYIACLVVSAFIYFRWSCFIGLLLCNGHMKPGHRKSFHKCYSLIGKALERKITCRMACCVGK